MCAICGCGTASLAAGPSGNDAGHGLPGHAHDHGPGVAHDHHHGGAEQAIDGGPGAAGLAVPGLSPARRIRVERNILSKNNGFAAANRRRFQKDGIFALNLVSSPGSGKTSLLVRTIDDLKPRFAIAVIEGDQQTSNDAERIRATGVPAIQINTGKGCHLDAHMVGHALDRLSLATDGLLFIENVGNLVCPAAFDLGEAHKVVVLSVTEGEDKPLKYPDMFAAADLMLLTKIDLLPHLDFDVTACIDAARRVNPGIAILELSAKTGAGMADFYGWIAERAGAASRPVARAV